MLLQLDLQCWYTVAGKEKKRKLLTSVETLSKIRQWIATRSYDRGFTGTQ